MGTGVEEIEVSKMGIGVEEIGSQQNGNRS